MEAVSGWFTSITKPLFTPTAATKEEEEKPSTDPTSDEKNDSDDKKPFSEKEPTQPEVATESSLVSGKALEDAAKKAVDSAKAFTSKCIRKVW